MQDAAKVATTKIAQNAIMLKFIHTLSLSPSGGNHLPPLGGLNPTDLWHYSWLGSWGHIRALDLKTAVAVCVFILQLGGVRISIATNNIALYGFIILNQSCCSTAVLSMSAWSISDTLPFEHSAAGQTAPDGVAGDSACTDLGGLTGRNAGLGWEGHGSSTCYLLGSVWALYC